MLAASEPGLRGGSPTRIGVRHNLTGRPGAVVPPTADLAPAGTLVAGYLTSASDALRTAFGTAELPVELR